MRFYFTLCLLLISMNSIGQSRWLLRNATVYLGTGDKITECDILVEDGKIVEVGKDLHPMTKAEGIDLTGKYIMPGMIDAHIHFFQTGFFDSRPDVVDIRDSISYLEVCDYQAQHPERYYQAYLRSGVTAVYDVGGFLWSLDLIQRAEDNPRAPHVGAAGPLLTHFSPNELDIYNTTDDSVMISMTSESVVRKAVRRNCEMGATGIKIWGYDIRDADFEEYLKAAQDEAGKLENNLIAHATTLAQAKMALRYGAELLVHGVSDSIIDQEFIDLAIANDVIYNPTLIVTSGYINSFKSLRGVPLPSLDSNEVVDERTMALLARAGNFSKYRQSFMTDSTYLAMYDSWFEVTKPRQDSIDHANMRLIHDAGLRIAVGTDAGNPGTLHGVSYIHELEATQAAGFLPEQIIVMATKNGAQAMERFRDIGSLEAGKLADLIILDQDPGKDISNVRTITHVMRGGKLLNVADEW